MPIMFYDFETSGVPDNDARRDHSHPSWPWPVSCAFVVTDDNLVPIQKYHQIINVPHEVVLSPGAERIHGITRERMNADGIPPLTLVSDFMTAAQSCELRLAYNDEFDKGVINALAHRLSPESLKFLNDESRTDCLMNMVTNFLKIPGGTGGTYRRQKLSQAYTRITKRHMTNAHDALADVEACVEIYDKMLDAVK